MATTTINIGAQIHAEIKDGDKTSLAYTPIMIDPLSKSYSGNGQLTTYRFTIKSVQGLKNPRILTNGKNSRFTAGGEGTCQLELYIEDDKGNSDTDTITITII